MEDNRKLIQVVYCEPGKIAKIKEIKTGLENLQQAVGGLIETYYPFDEPVCVVCNDEGKINGMRPCRAVYGEDGELMDIIFGPFFICDSRGEDFGSLSEEQLKRYEEKFRLPEYFFKGERGVGVVRYDPTGSRDRGR